MMRALWSSCGRLVSYFSINRIGANGARSAKWQIRVFPAPACVGA
jgi:hypothetical protein